MSKRDDISKLYKTSNVFEKICSFLFYLNIVVSIINLFICKEVNSYCTILLIIIALLYMLLSVINDSFFWYSAENERRKNPIQKAFGIVLSEYDTEGYYNNNLKDPELSYAVNLFESLFYTKEISNRMIAKSCVKSFLAIVVLIISCRFTINDELLLIISQTAFSTVLIEETFRLFVFTYRIRELFESFYREFVTTGITHKSQRVLLRSYCLEYECIKAHYKIRINESLYNKLNSELSEKWTHILNQIKTKAS